MLKYYNLPSCLLMAAVVVLAFVRCSKDEENGSAYLNVTQELPAPFSSEGGTHTLIFSTNEAWEITIEPSVESDVLKSGLGAQPSTATNEAAASAASTQSIAASAATKTKATAGEWYKLSRLSGVAAENISVQVTLQPNEAYTNRGFTLILHTPSREKRIEVVQSKKNVIIADENLRAVSSSEQPLSVKVKSNATYGIEIKEGKDWIKEAPQGRSEMLKEVTHNFIVSENLLDTQRTGVIVFRDKETDLFDEVTVVQAAWEDPNVQRTALVSLYNEMGGSGWTKKNNWCSDKPLGGWYGVETDAQGNVTALRLSNNNLTGAISWELSKLSKLQHLDLSWNAIEGEIAKTDSENNIVSCLDGLTDAETINLGHNNITSEFMPFNIYKLLHLKSLDLSFNKLACFAFPLSWKPMFENGQSIDLILNNNYLYDSDVPDFIQNHPDWGRIALQCIRQYLDNGGISYTKDIILPDFTFTDLRNGSKQSIRDLYTSKTMTMILAWDPTQEDSKTFMETTVRRFHTLYKGQGFEVVAITPEGDKYRRAAEQYLQTHDVPYPVVTDYADAQGRRIAIPCEPYPSYFLVDKTGVVLKDMFTGQRSSDILPGEPYYIDFMKFSFQHTNDLSTIFNKVFGLSQYQSKDFSMDKKYETLQRATKGKGIDIVLIGDAYTDIDIETGLYRQVMEFAMESFFLLEPTKSYREYFNVHMVYAVSKDAYITKKGGSTALGVRVVNKEFDGYIATIRLPDYCRAIGKQIPVVGTFVNGMNSGKAYLPSANNSNNTNYGFAGLGLGATRSVFRDVFIHETVGHAFALLADEYTGNNNAEIPEYEKSRLLSYQKDGLFLNVSTINDPKTVYWSHLIGHPKYPYVGIHEGGYVYSKGIWTCEVSSAMSNQHNLYFNAICRELIVKRIMELSGEEFTIDKFMEKDVYDKNPLPRSVTPSQKRQINEYKTNHQPPVIMN